MWHLYVWVFSQIKWWKEQVVTSSWIIYWLIYILVLMYGHKLWVVIKRTRSRIQAVEICFLPTREVWCWPPLTGSCSEFDVTLCGASVIFVTRCVAPHPLSANFFRVFCDCPESLCLNNLTSEIIGRSFVSGHLQNELGFKYFFPDCNGFTAILIKFHYRNLGIYKCIHLEM